jgi:hypothetical protein
MNLALGIAGVAAVFLLLMALGRWPYSFYTLARVVVCVSAISLGIMASQCGKNGSMLVFFGCALLFNPLLPVRLKRQQWKPIDIVGAIILCGAVVPVAIAERASPALRH